MDNSDPRAPEARLGFLVYRAGLAVSRGYERALVPLGVSPGEVGVLSALSYSGPAHVRSLARRLGVGRQTAVNLTKTLLARAEIARREGEDMRLVIYDIAEPGRRKLEECETVVQVFDAKLRETVGAQHEADLIERLRKIVDADFLAYDD